MSDFNFSDFLHNFDLTDIEQALRDNELTSFETLAELYYNFEEDYSGLKLNIRQKGLLRKALRSIITLKPGFRKPLSSLDQRSSRSPVPFGVQSAAGNDPSSSSESLGSACLHVASAATVGTSSVRFEDGGIICSEKETQLDEKKVRRNERSNGDQELKHQPEQSVQITNLEQACSLVRDVHDVHVQTDEHPDEEEADNPETHSDVNREYRNESQRLKVGSTQTPTIIVIGEVGSGKSSIANQILGWEAFVTAKTVSNTQSNTSTTKYCTLAKNEEGERLCVIDTPGFCAVEENIAVRGLIIQRSLLLAEPGPHIFLLPVKAIALKKLIPIIDLAMVVFGQKMTEHLLVIVIGDETESDSDVFTYLKQLKISHIKIQDTKAVNRRQILERVHRQPYINSTQGNKDVLESHKDTLKGDLLTGIRILKNAIETKVATGKLKENGSPRRLMLIGKTGHGKSSSGNNILGWTAFQPGESASAVTRKCVMAEGDRNGNMLRVVDTPGLFDDDYTFIDTAIQIQSAVHLLTPGPHGFIIVLRCDTRVSREEKLTIDALKVILGEEFTRYAVIAFSHRANLKQPLMKYVMDDSIKPLIQSVGWRIFGFENDDGASPEHNEISKMLLHIGYFATLNDTEYYDQNTFDLLENLLEGDMRVTIKEEQLSTQIQRLGKLLEENRLKAAKGKIKTAQKVGTVLAGSVTGGVASAVGVAAGSSVLTVAAVAISLGTAAAAISHNVQSRLHRNSD